MGSGCPEFAQRRVGSANASDFVLRFLCWFITAAWLRCVARFVLGGGCFEPCSPHPLVYAMHQSYWASSRPTTTDRGCPTVKASVIVYNLLFKIGSLEDVEHCFDWFGPRVCVLRCVLKSETSTLAWLRHHSWLWCWVRLISSASYSL